MSEDTPEKLSPDEHRRQMKRNFDAVNAEAEIGKNSRRNIGTIRDADEKRRWSTREPAPADVTETPEVGENDSSGG